MRLKTFTDHASKTYGNGGRDVVSMCILYILIHLEIQLQTRQLFSNKSKIVKTSSLKPSMFTHAQKRKLKTMQSKLERKVQKALQGLPDKTNWTQIVSTLKMLSDGKSRRNAAYVLPQMTPNPISERLIMANITKNVDSKMVLEVRYAMSALYDCAEDLADAFAHCFVHRQMFSAIENDKIEGRKQLLEVQKALTDAKQHNGVLASNSGQSTSVLKRYIDLALELALTRVQQIIPQANQSVS